MWTTLKSFLFGPPAPAKLPARVKEELSRREAESEILVGWVQMLANIFFYIVYELSPKTFPADATFEPVPTALMIYSWFTAFRLYLAYKRRLAPPILVISIFMDVCVLMVTIWSFHIQYDQPPSFYLKAPTMMYVFIIVALRALRFEVKYILLAGASSIMAWLALICYALVYNPPGTIITRDYVDYMMSFNILIGAEVDKLLTIMMVTLILSLVIIRARRILVRAIVEQSNAVELSRFMDASVADRIRQSDNSLRAGHGEIRDAAVMFIDLRGFTPLSESLKPDRLLRLLADYQHLCVPLIDAKGGQVDKFMGDGILASFGAASPSDTPAADAISCAQSIHKAANAWQEDRKKSGRPAPNIGVSVVAGPVIFGTIGDMDRLEYTILGNTVNLAAKLEKHSKSEQAAGLTTRYTLELAKQQGLDGTNHLEVRRNRHVEGVEHPMDLVILEKLT